MKACLNNLGPWAPTAHEPWAQGPDWDWPSGAQVGPRWDRYVALGRMDLGTSNSDGLWGLICGNSLKTHTSLSKLGPQYCHHYTIPPVSRTVTKLPPSHYSQHVHIYIYDSPNIKKKNIYMCACICRWILQLNPD